MSRRVSGKSRSNACPNRACQGRSRASAVNEVASERELGSTSNRLPQDPLFWAIPHVDKLANDPVNKLNEAEGEAAETQVWLEYAVRCGSVSTKAGRELHRAYDKIIGKLVNMGNKPQKWVLRKTIAGRT